MHFVTNARTGIVLCDSVRKILTTFYVQKNITFKQVLFNHSVQIDRDPWNSISQLFTASMRIVNTGHDRTK